MTAKHTATPWYQVTCDDRTTICGDNLDVCIMCEGDAGEHLPDTEFIVRACNSHSTLIAGATDLLRAINKLPHTKQIEDAMAEAGLLSASMNMRAAIANATKDE